MDGEAKGQGVGSRQPAVAVAASKEETFESKTKG